MPTCKICNEEMAEEQVVTVTYVCKHRHGGSSPKVGAANTLCPAKLEGSIWVHVIDDAGNEVPDIPTTIATVETVTKKGLATSGPLPEKEYSVAIGKLPEKYLPLAMPSADDVPVKPGEVTRVEFQLVRATKMTVTVKRADPDGDGFVKDVEVTVSGQGDSPPKKPTRENDGSADFEKLHPGEHQASIVFDTDNYCLQAGTDKKSWDAQPDQPNNVVFTLTPLVWIKVVVQGQSTDPVQPTGKVKLKKTDSKEETKAFPDANAVEFSKMKKEAATCSIEEVSIDGDELYEVGKVS